MDCRFSWRCSRANVAGRRKGPWTLGRFGATLNVAAIVWIVFMSVLMSVPPTGEVGVTMGAMAVVLVVAWFGGVRRHFKGPIIPTS